MGWSFTAEERRLLIGAFRERVLPDCPACGGRLTRAAVPPKRHLAYVRDRVWILCAACGRSAVINRGEIEAGDR